MKGIPTTTRIQGHPLMIEVGHCYLNRQYVYINQVCAIWKAKQKFIKDFRYRAKPRQRRVYG